jgi:hypothetical protein
MRQMILAAGLCAALMVCAAPADAQRLYKGVPTSCPEGTRPVPETDNCVPLNAPLKKKVVRQQPATSCPAGTVPVPQTDNCVRGSTVCFFRSGPRSGSTYDFAAMGFKPIPYGTPCGDGLGSRGFAGRPYQ